MSAAGYPPAMPSDPIKALLKGLPAAVEVQAQQGGLWGAIGRGRLASPAPRALEFRGHLDAILPGEASFSLALTGEETARFAVGPERSDDARWWAYGDGIVVTAWLSGGAGEATFTPGSGGLYLELAGAIRARLWLGPDPG